MLQFEIEFNETIIREQSRLASKILFKKAFNKIRGLFLFAIIISFLGLIAGIDNKEFLNPFTLIGLILLTFILIIGSTTFLVFQRINSQIKSSNNKAISDKFNNHYEFNDEGFIFSGKYRKTEIKWGGIHGYSIIEDNIFIMPSMFFEFSYIIGKQEISQDNYDALINILNNRTSFIEYKK